LKSLKLAFLGNLKTWVHIWNVIPINLLVVYPSSNSWNNTQDNKVFFLSKIKAYFVSANLQNTHLKVHCDPKHWPVTTLVENHHEYTISDECSLLQLIFSLLVCSQGTLWANLIYHQHQGSIFLAYLTLFSMVWLF
jgi:hypothetical protein